MNSILPPATLGLMGGGQLGRMTALAARSAGYRIHALDPDPNCAIRPLVENFIAAGWDDATRETARRHIRLYKRLRPILRDGDVYHVLPQATGHAWDGLDLLPVRPMVPGFRWIT